MVSFENFVKSMPTSLSELKVLPSFCFAFKIPDDLTATNTYNYLFWKFLSTYLLNSAGVCLKNCIIVGSFHNISK